MQLCSRSSGDVRDLQELFVTPCGVTPITAGIFKGWQTSIENVQTMRTEVLLVSKEKQPELDKHPVVSKWMYNPEEAQPGELWIVFRGSFRESMIV